MLVCEATQSAISPSYDAGRIQTASSRHRLQRNMRVACITASDTTFAMCQEARLLCLWGAHCCFRLLPHYRRAVASCSNLEAEALTSLTAMCMVLSHAHLSIPHNRLQACRRASNEVDSVLDSSRPAVRDMLRHLSFLPRVPATGRHFGALLHYSSTPIEG